MRAIYVVVRLDPGRRTITSTYASIVLPAPARLDVNKEEDRLSTRTHASPSPINVHFPPFATTGIRRSGRTRALCFLRGAQSSLGGTRTTCLVTASQRWSSLLELISHSMWVHQKQCSQEPTIDLIHIYIVDGVLCIRTVHQNPASQ